MANFTNTDSTGQETDLIKRLDQEALRLLNSGLQHVISRLCINDNEQVMMGNRAFLLNFLLSAETFSREAVWAYVDRLATQRPDCSDRDMQEAADFYLETFDSVKSRKVSLILQSQFPCYQLIKPQGSMDGNIFVHFNQATRLSTVDDSNYAVIRSLIARLRAEA